VQRSGRGSGRAGEGWWWNRDWSGLGQRLRLRLRLGLPARELAAGSLAGWGRTTTTGHGNTGGVGGGRGAAWTKHVKVSVAEAKGRAASPVPMAQCSRADGG
jgi:hypothetical protein